MTAVLLTCVTVAVPAKANEAELSVNAWSEQVGRSLGNTLRPMDGVHSVMRNKPATLIAKFDSEGRYTGVTLASSTGSKLLDREAKRAVGHVRYPALPTTLRQNGKVTIEVVFADDIVAKPGRRDVPRYRLIARSYDVPAGQPQR
ncbi:energy transducer TonB [Sphingomonas sp. S1-29]|uniref:energy transducer TonB family protein n=1 Tax=Sphingomonas sp. S1-29 TaxID=2991074 RepID=UPI002240AF96|nr:energy transducer TonB [Sphingomonas sp. S1-29]UZK69822.1 energy transducer TonB [Sphingomonas sp. S1-29]